MDPGPASPVSWLQRRGVDLAVWVLVILAILGLAAAVAWVLPNIRFDLREVSLPSGNAEVQKPSAPSVLPPTSVESRDAPAPVGPGTSSPSWVTQPMVTFPERALWSGQSEGTVWLTCVAEVSGRLSQCRVVNERPAGYDFGESAVRGAEQARVKPRMSDGVAEPSKINFVVRFQIEP